LWEFHVNCGVIFLYLVDKPGKVYIGRLNCVNEVNVNIPEIWGRKPGKSVQVGAMAIVAETC
jgi:hypothetical protein